MCKNLMIAGIDPALSNDDVLWKFIIAAGAIMSTNDKDGVGYSAMSLKNGLYGERWVDPSDAFHVRNPLTKADHALNERLGGVLDMATKYNRYGVQDSKDTTAVVLHARMSTNKVNIENTHPFVDVDENVALIHNGIVQSFNIKNETSSCDSELLLNAYVKYDLANEPANISKLSEDIRGSYACGVLGTTTEGVPYLDLFRNDTNSLYAIQVKELGAVVFTTEPSHVERACAKLNWKYSGAYRLKAEVLIRLNAHTGALISKHAFKSVSNYYNHYPAASHYGKDGY